MPCRCSSQLSYSPIELVILGKVNAGPLAVLGGPQPKLHLPLADEQRLGQKVATVDGSAVDREQVDLRPLVARPHVARRRAPVRLDADRNDVAVSVGTSPLALHSVKVVPDLEQHVGATVLTDRSIDSDPRARSGEGDFEFSDVAFPIRIVHEQMFACDPDGIRLIY